MNREKIIAAARKYVKSHCRDAEPGHDWFHIERVVRNAKRIAAREGGDVFVVEMAALLHDVDDFKFAAGAKKVGTFLNGAGLDKKTAEKIIHITENVSFKGSAEKNKISCLEGRIVQDADRLDAIGAIGVARCFSYAGFRKNPFYDPKIRSRDGMKFKEYKRSRSPAVNHFFEKLLLLKGRMNMKTGRKMAESRHKFMKAYLSEFFKEWEGKD